MQLRRRDTGEEFAFELPAIIGRQDSCVVVVDHASVSRQHLELSEAKSGVLLKDLGSSNGTRRNGQLLKVGVLHDGDLLTVGAVAFDVLLPLATDGDLKVEEATVAETVVEPKPAGHSVRSERARHEARAAKKSSGLGDLSQQSTFVQILVAMLGVAFVAGVAYLVKWLGGAL